MADITLQMKFHKKVGRWTILIQGTAVPKVVFPSDERLMKLWETHVPSRGGLLDGFMRGSGTEGEPTNGMWVEVGSGSTPSQRKAFLKALAAECKIPEVV